MRSNSNENSPFDNNKNKKSLLDQLDKLRKNLDPGFPDNKKGFFPTELFVVNPKKYINYLLKN
jgi:hypothetical protein